ncbi:MAG: glycan-binding surface protein [Candidatus Pseudobacter hemicellulosilyticus]|uniref:Glycan-binding surface protein n=1 Tax=Candidatus Pseudobacter hemicellulosilyticus TaxID=3121375 RepID=A0AAJ6BD92_9BACT|nr:MAG: glycan-binding surface protein [Pseudobacter sp.]
MKQFIHNIQLLALMAGLVLLYTACNKDDDGGTPLVSYVRVMDPASADSLLIGAGQGNMVAIIGENLGKAKEVWFNDQKAYLVPTYITSTSIITVVPSNIPENISNTMRIIFSNGYVLSHPFETQISKPTMSSMFSEYVAEGEVATIRGNYFYEPLTVTFAGGVTGELVSVKDEEIQVTVPEGAQPGQLIVKTNFGETKSNFWFRDNRNIVISSDPFTGWWNEGFVVTDPGPEDPVKINGNYIRVHETIGSWTWKEVAGGPNYAMGDISKNIPDEAIIKPENYNLKFEVNTLKPYNNNMIKLNFGLPNDFNNDNYLWAPPIDTKGKWQTIVIPFETLTKNFGTLTVNPDGYWTRVLFHGAGELDADISFDNFRVVPKTLK